jgi:hypothetical protein
MFGDDKDNKKTMGDHGDDEMTPRDVEKIAFFQATMMGCWEHAKDVGQCKGNIEDVK